MKRLIRIAELATTLAALGWAGQATAQPVAFEGARLITGDGSAPIENSVFVVENGRFTTVGAAASTTIPAGIETVDLGGMTVMPAVIDAHTHLSTTRDELIADLKRRAYYGVAAAVSLGADGPGAPIEIRNEVIPGAALYRTAGWGITVPLDVGAHKVRHWTVEVNQVAHESRVALRQSILTGS